MGITHATAATGSDSGDGKISKNAWNEDHVFTGIDKSFIGCALTKSGTQSIEASSSTAITFDGEDFDTDGFHSTSVNTDRVTIPAGLGGKYLLNASAEIATLADQKSFIGRFRIDGTTYVQGRDRKYASGSSFLSVSHSVVVDLAAGSYVEWMVEHNDTVSRDVRATADGTSFSVVKLDSGKVGQGIGARVYRSTSQAISTANETAITFDTENFDTDGFHSTSVNTERFTIPAGLGGKYLIGGNVYADVGSGKYFSPRIRKGGSTALAAIRGGPSPDLNSIYEIVTVADLAAGDYVELTVQSDDTSYNVLADSSVLPNFWIMRLDSGGLVGPSLIHTHSITTEHTGTSCGGSWTDLSSNTTFTKTRNSSLLRVSGRFAGQVRETTSGEDLAGARVVIDSGGTPQYLMIASGLWNDTMASNYWMLQGGATTHLTGLAAGSHTVKIQAIAGTTGDIYLRPSAGAPYEYGVVEIVEE